MKLPRSVTSKLPAGVGVNPAALAQAVGLGVNLAAMGVADGSEAEFLAVVVQIAERNGWEAYHVPDSRRVTASGFPDLVLMRGSVVIVAELKKRGEVPRPEQWAWLRAFEACGVRAFFWTPDDLDRIPEVLK